MSQDWPHVALGELLAPANRPVTVEPIEEYALLGVRLDGMGPYLRETRKGSGLSAKTLLRVKAGDFIYSRLFAWRGAFGVVPPELENCLVSSEFPTFRPRDHRIDVAFLSYWFRLPAVLRAVEAQCTGSTPLTRNRFKEEFFLNLEVPLPPRREQRRIVGRIHDLSMKVSEATTLRAQSKLELHALVSQSVEALLRAGRYEERVFGDLLREPSRNGLSARPSPAPPGLPILRISAGTSSDDGLVDEQDYKYLEIADSAAADYFLQPGDLLACRFNGNLHYVGRFSLFAGQYGEPRLYPDKLIRFRVDTRRLVPEFVVLVMNSPYGRSRIERFCQTTAGNIGISATNLRTIALPVPTLDEQRYIVDHLRGLQGAIARVAVLQAHSAAELDALLPSILDKSFNEEPQDVDAMR